MRRKVIALSILGLAFALPLTQVLAQRGGRGGGRGRESGMSRGGGGERGGGGFGGGLSEGSRGGESRPGGERGGESRPGEGRGGESRPGEGSRGSSGMGPYGHEGSGSSSAHRPGMGSGSSSRPGAGSSASSRPGAGTASGATRPGTQGSGAAGKGAAAAAANQQNNVRPGAAAAAGAASQNNNVRPGAAAAAGAASQNNNVSPGAAAAMGAASQRNNVSPGAAALAGAAYASPPSGTYFKSAAAISDQGAAVRAANTYPAYNAATYNALPNAWHPTNLNNTTLYANPGYAALAATLGLAQRPIPYDYGGNVVAQPQAIYVNGDNVGTPQQYSDQAGQLAANGNSQPPENSSWQPLGVFAMVEGDQTTSDDTFQLAVNPQGMIRGNYHSLKDNSVVSLAGSVDPKTQRAAWTIGGDKFPVYEAGIANLTQHEAPMLLLLGNDQPPRQFFLIRLQQPTAGN